MRGSKKTLVWVVASLFLLLLACLLAFSILYLTGPKRVPGPLVTIRSPHPGEQVAVGEVVAVHSTSRDEANKVVRVELWADGKLIEFDTHERGAAVLSLVQGWQPISPGFHTLIVRAFNSAKAHGQATIGVEAVEAPEEVAEERPPVPEEIVEGGQIPPGSEIPPSPGGLPSGEEVPPTEEIPPVEDISPSPDPDLESPSEDAGDIAIDEVLRFFSPGVVLRIAPTLVEFEALDFEVEGDYDEIYCYASLADEPIERIPEDGSFRPAGGRHWDIAEYAGGENSRTIAMILPAPLRVFVECYGLLGDDLHYLGLLDVSHPPEDWDGHIIHASGTEGEGFRVAYRINPSPSAIPAPYNLEHVLVGERDYLHWMWDGDEVEIDGFRIYQNDILISSLPASDRLYPLASWELIPPCSEEYQYYMVAYQGDFGPEGLESSPSNFVRFEGTPCGEVDDIGSPTIFSTLCSGAAFEFQVPYIYASDHGDVSMGILPYKDGIPAVGFGYVPTGIVHGEGTAQIEVIQDGSEPVTTDQLLVFMNDSEGTVFYVERFDLPLTWAPPLPDLTITNARVTLAPDNILLEADVRNAGCKWVEGPFILGRTPSGGEEVTLSIDESLGLGETYHVVLGYSPERVEEFRNGFIVTVDPLNSIPEYNEDNNSYEVGPVGLKRVHYYQICVHDDADPWPKGDGELFYGFWANEALSWEGSDRTWNWGEGCHSIDISLTPALDWNQDLYILVWGWESDSCFLGDCDDYVGEASYTHSHDITQEGTWKRGREFSARSSTGHWTVYWRVELE